MKICYNALTSALKSCYSSSDLDLMCYAIETTVLKANSSPLRCESFLPIAP